jgi:peptide-methionine (S)-S-oxide reductase
MSLLESIQKISEGYSEGIYNHKKYSITKQIFNKGKSFKIFGKELKGKDFISLNYYITSKNELLKPCEMPKEKVIDFIKKIKII